MHLAELARIRVVPHSLIRLRSGELAYITKRIDRVKKKKLHMEDMCQLTERLTEDKYRGSYEQIAKAILKYSVNPGLDVVNFLLSPAYDLVATSLVNPVDDEDMALTLNAKKKRLKRQDFLAAFTASRLDSKQQENIFNKMNKAYFPVCPAAPGTPPYRLSAFPRRRLAHPNRKTIGVNTTGIYR